MNPPVYRTYGGYRWHWSDTRRRSGYTAARCNGSQLSSGTATEPASTPAGDRCRANGCRQMWTAWTETKAT